MLDTNAATLAPFLSASRTWTERTGSRTATASRLRDMAFSAADGRLDTAASLVDVDGGDACDIGAVGSAWVDCEAFGHRASGDIDGLTVPASDPDWARVRLASQESDRPRERLSCAS